MTNRNFGFTGADKREVAQSFRVAGDTQDRRQVRSDGLTLDGPGDVAPFPAHFDWSEALTNGYGQCWPPRAFLNYSNSAVTLTSGVVRFTYFRACRTETLTTIKGILGGTAAGATPTISRFGLYKEDQASGDLTLVASTTNDTALFTGSTSQEFTKDLTTAYEVKRGTRYAGAWLCVTGAAAPTIVGASLGSSAGGYSNLCNRFPRLNGQLTGQTDLPASVTSANVGADPRFILTYFS
jgi:hypothetical protein